MKADAHRRLASSLERAIALVRPDPTTSVAILENAWGAAYHWISYGCVQNTSSTETWHQGLTAYLVGLGERRLSQWWRIFEVLRQSGFYGNQAGESEVQEALDLLERFRTWATTEIGRTHEEGTYSRLAGRSDGCSCRRNSAPARSRGMLPSYSR